MTAGGAGCCQRWQRVSAMCSFKRAMAMATRSASCRSSEGESLRSLMRFRIRSRASWNSLSSLACSGQLMARVEGEHIRHLLKTPRRKIAKGRTKGKHYFRLLFADRDRFSGLDEIVNTEINDLSGVGQRLFVSVAPRVAALEGGAGRMPRIATLFELVWLHSDFENVGFHR